MPAAKQAEERLPRLKREIYNRLPYRLRLINLIRYNSEDWARAGAIFIHVPKAAGTSINLALYGRFMGHFTARDVKRWASPEVRNLPLFAVTRNPWDRLVSAYRFLKRGKGVGGDHQVRVRRAEQYAAPEFRTFESFVGEWLVFRDIRRLDLALQPQWRFICDSDGALLVNHLGRIEDFGPTADYLRKTLGHAPQMSVSNRSGDPVDYRDFYTPSLKQMVAGIYGRDIEMFGYKF